MCIFNKIGSKFILSLELFHIFDIEKYFENNNLSLINILNVITSFVNHLIYKNCFYSFNNPSLL